MPLAVRNMVPLTLGPTFAMMAYVFDPFLGSYDGLVQHILVVRSVDDVRSCCNGWYNGHVGGSALCLKLCCLHDQLLDDGHNGGGIIGLDSKDCAGVDSVGAAPQQLRHPLP